MIRYVGTRSGDWRRTRRRGPPAESGEFCDAVMVEVHSKTRKGNSNTSTSSTSSFIASADSRDAKGEKTAFILSEKIQ